MTNDKKEKKGKRGIESQDERDCRKHMKKKKKKKTLVKWTVFGATTVCYVVTTDSDKR